MEERSKRQRGQIIVADRVKELYKRYCEGESMKEVGKYYGVSKQRVSQLFKQHGYIVRPPHIHTKKQRN